MANFRNLFDEFKGQSIDPKNFYGGACPATEQPTSKEDTMSGSPSSGDDCHTDEVKEDCPTAPIGASSY
ncbi:MAG TPA: hypothetical protein PKD51_13905 [Saprospiraceae bacterium]|nr:hypothetical protein [Saprospiraceae bacterium]